MTYTVPAPAPDPKTRFTVTTDPEIILAIQRNGMGGRWWVEVESLRQYREALPAVGGQP